MTDQPPGSKSWTVQEWTTHVLNIHGAIFERWVADVVRKSHSWQLVATEYPVEYPPPEGGARGYETALDLRAEFSRPDLDGDLIVLIECKKNNPGFSDWVFFEANRHTPRIPHLWANQIRSTQQSGEVRPSPKFALCGFQPVGLVADHASETRGSYDDPNSRRNTKTSAQAINDACHQVAIATQAIVHEEHNRLVTDYQRSQGWRPKKELLTFIPVIVTTAKLHVLRFDPSRVSPETGEIDRKDAALQAVEWLDYLYPIPRHLQFGGDPDVPWYQLMKLPIAIVSSRYFKKFLDYLSIHHGFYA